MPCQVQLTVNFLNVNVISLRVTDGDLLLKFALPEDETFLQSDDIGMKISRSLLLIFLDMIDITHSWYYTAK